MSGKLHGGQSPEDYKRGERTYRFLRAALNEWDVVNIGFHLPGIGNSPSLTVKGLLTQVFRSSEVPFAELAYLEHADNPRLYVSRDFFSEDPSPQELIGALEFSVEMQKHDTLTGQIPEGIVTADSAIINLAYIAINSFDGTKNL